MSNSKGSILISNANAVGTKLVSKLGGTGYTPNEWADKINLLGISDADIPTALAGITEGSYTGEDRGSIKICNANNVGTILNKKFNTNRGFKPTEWESAIDKLTALTTGTVSGSIVSFSDGADDVPLTKCEVTLPASLDGYSSVNVIHTGKNLFDNSEFPKTNSDTNYYGQFQSNVGIENQWYIPEIHIVPDIQYTLSFDVSCNVEPFNISIGIGRGGYLRDLTTATNRTNGRNSITFTLTSALMEQYGDILTFRIPRFNSSTSFEFTISNIQLEVGSTASTFESYTAPTTHTAQLGRTIYGGSADVVMGDGVETVGRLIFDGSADENWSARDYSLGIFQLSYTADFTATGNYYDTVLCNNFTRHDVTSSTSLADGEYVYFSSTGNLFVRKQGETLESFKTYLSNNNMIIEGNLTTPEPFTFDPVPINSKKGNNTIWSDGDIEVTYYKGV